MRIYYLFQFIIYIYIENREREVNNKNTEKNNKQEANIYKNKTYKSKEEKLHNERVDCGCVKRVCMI